MITVEDVKTHLRVDGNAEDSYLGALIGAAAEYIEKRTGVIHDADYPLTLKHAGLLIIGHWYANREAVSDAPATEVPLAFRMLIDINRDGASFI